MIGEKIRSVHHLLGKLKKRNVIDILLISDNNNYQRCKVMKYGERSIVVFNNFHGDDISYLSEINVPSDVENDFRTFIHVRKLSDLTHFGFNEIICFDFNLLEEVNKFVSLNLLV